MDVGVEPALIDVRVEVGHDPPGPDRQAELRVVEPCSIEICSDRAALDEVVGGRLTAVERGRLAHVVDAAAHDAIAANLFDPEADRRCAVAEGHV